MSAFSEVRRAEVSARAGHRCEYCRLPTRGQVATFPIDHIVPRSAGGTNDPNNLALTCPHCNAQKWTAAEGVGPGTGARTPLFHPRPDDWGEHFAWSDEHPGELIGLTGTDRATIVSLRVNDADMVALRLLLAEVGLFSEVHR